MKKVLSAFAVALALVGCAKQYDDSDLRNRVTTLETKVGNLEAQMKAANAVALGQYVQKVEKTDEGVTVTYGDGTVVTLKISAGGAGSLTVVKNAKQELCWAIDGEILQFEGKDLLVSQVTNIYVENGKLYAVIAGEKKELGGFESGTALKDGIFKNIEVTATHVVLTLSDNSKVNIPIGSAFKLVIPKTTYKVTTTDAFDVPYTVNAKIDGTEVDIFTDANFKATVEADKFVITPKAVAEGTALAYADSKVGLTSIVKLTFGAEEEQAYATPSDPKADEQNNIDYIGESANGSVDAHIVSNVSLDKNSIKPQVSWISVVDVKANNYTITLALEDNPTEEIRTGEVFIYEAGTENKLQTIVIAQKARQVEYEYYNPTGWNKVFNMADYKINSTFKWENGLTLNPSNITFQWKFYSNKWNNHKFQDKGINNIPLEGNRLGEFSNLDESKTVLLRFSNDGEADGQLCLNAGFLGIDQKQVRKDNKPYVWPVGKWVVISIVCDGSKVYVYHDDSLVAEYSSFGPDASWTLGRFDLSMTWDDGGSFYPIRQAFNGYSAYARVWSRALSVSDIAATLCEVPDANKEGLEVEWKFDGAEEKAVTNSAGKNTNLELDFTNCWDGNNHAKDNGDAAAAAWTTLAGSTFDGICSKVKGEGGNQPGGGDQPGGETEQNVKVTYWGNKDAAVWYKNFPAAIPLTEGYSMTIHFFVETAKKQRLCNFGDASEAPCNMLRFGEHNNKPKELEWMVDTGEGRIKVYADGVVENQWNAITVTAGANGYTTYLNGEKKETQAKAYRANTSFQGFEFADSWGDRGAFDGAIAYVSLWDKQLSDEEVAANVFKVPSGDGLKLFWPMTDGEGYFMEEKAGKVNGDYAIDFTQCKRKNGNDVEGNADVSSLIVWKEYPAIKAPVAAE